MIESLFFDVSFSYSPDGRHSFFYGITEYLLWVFQVVFLVFFLGEFDDFLGHNTLITVLFQGFHGTFVATEKQIFDL